MKVNEIIVESWFDLYKQARSVTAQAKASNASTAEYDQAINNFQSQLAISSPESAEELANLRQNYKLNPSAKNAKAIGKFIADTSKQVNNPTVAQDAIKSVMDATKELTTPTATNYDIPAYVRKSKTAAPTTSPESDREGSGLDAGFTVISSADPLVLRYKNSDFALTKNDKWVYLGSNKEVSPEMTQYLNKQLKKL